MLNTLMKLRESWKARTKAMGRKERMKDEEEEEEEERWSESSLMRW